MNFFSRDLINFTFLNSFFRTLLKKRSFINRSDGLAKFFIREKSFWRNIFKLETKLFKKCSNSSVRLYVREVVTIPSFILKKIHRDRLIITGLHVNPPFSRICILSPSRTTSPAPFRPTDLVAPERLTPKKRPILRAAGARMPCPITIFPDPADLAGTFRGGSRLLLATLYS